MTSINDRVFNGVVSGTNTTTSSSNSTGALILTGGIGISNTTDAVSSSNGGTLTSGGGGSFAKKFYVGTNLIVSNIDMTPSPGDFPKEVSFSAANNQSSVANVTGLAFANGTVRSFHVIASITIVATSNVYAQFTLRGLQKSSSWIIDSFYIGDDTGIVFSITSAGQVQYTSTNLAGFSSNTMKFRSLSTTSV